MSNEIERISSISIPMGDNIAYICYNKQKWWREEERNREIVNRTRVGHCGRATVNVNDIDI